MLARNVAGREGSIRHPVAHNVHQALVPGRITDRNLTLYWIRHNTTNICFQPAVAWRERQPTSLAWLEEFPLLEPLFEG
jgi:hypothetical protein